MPGSVAPVVEIRLGDLGEHAVVEERAPERMSDELLRLTDAKELAGEARVAEVETWAPNDPFPEVAELHGGTIGISNTSGGTVLVEMRLPAEAAPAGG